MPMFRVVKLIVKNFLAIPIIFVGCWVTTMWLLQDVHKREVRNETDFFFFAVIVQTANGTDVIWGREELNKFVTENKDVRFIVQPSELEQIQYHFNEGRIEKGQRAIGVSAGPILDSRQVIKITIEEGPGLYTVAYEAAANGITPLYTTRYTIIDGVAHSGIAALATVIMLVAARKARKWLKP